ncbi:MAG: alginate lyase family protein [Verrucomicrobia bacterium]|nr:alginate lyase family protein [Verrucomicrobiota bacterium]
MADKTERAPSNDPRDYVSLSIYWWPNPLTRLPYLHRDGRRNPEADRYDAPKLRRMVSDVETLAAVFAATGDARFLNRAKEQLRVWFIAPGTRMNPHLTFAQMMPGWAAGGRQGIIEGLPLATRLVDVLAQLDAGGAFTAGERYALRDWLGRYLAWLRHSGPGRSEHDRPNNHGTWHDVQVAALATSLGMTDLARQTVSESLRRIETQFLADGRQPHELRRTKSFEYSLYNLDAWLHLAELGRRFHIEVWNHRNAAGASPATGLRYLEANVNAWPYPQLSAPSRTSLEELARRAKSIEAMSRK